MNNIPKVVKNQFLPFIWEVCKEHLYYRAIQDTAFQEIPEACSSVAIEILKVKDYKSPFWTIL